MDNRTIIPQSELPVNLNDTRSTVWAGMVGLITIETIVFTSLIAAYFYLRYYASEWPIGNISPPDLLLPTLNTGILLASILPIYYADNSIRKGNRQGLKIGLVVSFILGLAFLVIKVVEYSGYDYNWATNAYGSIVWTITGFHSAHVVALLLKTAVVFTAALRGHFSENRNMGVRINGLYWYFVVVVWLPLYFTLYLSHSIF
jgi:cytochrome c oxidase subunit III